MQDREAGSRSPEFRGLTPRLPVADLPRSLAFYCDRLGFSVCVRWPGDEPAFVILERDSASVGLFVSDDADRGKIGSAELYIQVSDARGLHAALREHVEIEWGPEVYSYGCREFAVRDPDGYLVIFTEPTDDSPTTEEPA